MIDIPITITVEQDTGKIILQGPRDCRITQGDNAAQQLVFERPAMFDDAELLLTFYSHGTLFEEQNIGRDNTFTIPDGLTQGKSLTLKLCFLIDGERTINSNNVTLLIRSSKTPSSVIESQANPVRGLTGKALVTPLTQGHHLAFLNLAGAEVARVTLPEGVPLDEAEAARDAAEAAAATVEIIAADVAAAGAQLADGLAQAQEACQNAIAAAQQARDAAESIGSAPALSGNVEGDLAVSGAVTSASGAISGNLSVGGNLSAMGGLGFTALNLAPSLTWYSNWSSNGACWVIKLGNIVFGHLGLRGGDTTPGTVVLENLPEPVGTLNTGVAAVSAASNTSGAFSLTPWGELVVLSLPNNNNMTVDFFYLAK